MSLIFFKLRKEGKKMLSSKEYTSIYSKLSVLREVVISEAEFAIEAKSFIRWSGAEMVYRIVNGILSEEFQECDELMKAREARALDRKVEDIAKFPEYPEFKYEYHFSEDDSDTRDFVYSDGSSVVNSDVDYDDIPF